MTLRWYIYVAAFLIGIGCVIGGIVAANSGLVFVGVIIGAVLFLTRKYISEDPGNG